MWTYYSRKLHRCGPNATLSEYIKSVETSVRATVSVYKSVVDCSYTGSGNAIIF